MLTAFYTNQFKKDFKSDLGRLQKKLKQLEGKVSPAELVAMEKYVKKIVRVGTKIVGEIRDDGFHKTVRESKHLMKMFDAWAMDARTFDGEIRPACSQMFYEDAEKKRGYSISVSDFLKFAFKREFGKFGLQYFCPRKFWQIQDSNQLELFTVLL